MAITLKMPASEVGEKINTSDEQAIAELYDIEVGDVVRLNADTFRLVVEEIKGARVSVLCMDKDDDMLSREVDPRVLTVVTKRGFRGH